MRIIIKDAWRDEVKDCLKLPHYANAGHAAFTGGLLAELAVREALRQLSPKDKVTWYAPFLAGTHPADLAWRNQMLDVKLVARTAQDIGIKVGAEGFHHVATAWVPRHVMDEIEILGVVTAFQPETFGPARPLADLRQLRRPGAAVCGWKIPVTRLAPLSLLLVYQP